MSAHNAETTLRRAVESVQNQTMRDIELVVVEPASEDGTGRMLDVASERDIRVVVQHVPVCSRETALDLAFDRARGDYLLVMDADGWYEPTYVQKLVSLAEKNHSQLVVGGFSAEVVMPRRTVELDCDDEEKVYFLQHDFRSEAWKHFSTGRLAPASAKLFERARAAEVGCRFDSGTGDDHSFSMAYLRDVERVSLGGSGYRVSRAMGEKAGVDAADELFGRIETAYDEIRGLYADWGFEGDPASMGTLQSRYVEMLSLCVEMACAEGGEAARALVGRMIGGERAQFAASVAQPRDNASRALIGPIKSQNVQMAMVQARLLSMMRRGAPATLTPDAFI